MKYKKWVEGAYQQTFLYTLVCTYVFVILWENNYVYNYILEKDFSLPVQCPSVDDRMWNYQWKWIEHTVIVRWHKAYSIHYLKTLQIEQLWNQLPALCYFCFACASGLSAGRDKRTQNHFLVAPVLPGQFCAWKRWVYAISFFTILRNYSFETGDTAGLAHTS